MEAYQTHDLKVVGSNPTPACVYRLMGDRLLAMQGA